MTINDIMREERERMLAELARLPLPQEARDDVLRACAAIQVAINAMIAALDRPIDGRVTPSAMRLLADEHERVSRRLADSGHAARLQ